MRTYSLNDTAWSRILTQRLRRPDVVATRMASRRRRAIKVPVDGRLVLLKLSGLTTDSVVGRRELLDRAVEALSVDGIDGVVGPIDLIEELTLLNVLEGRLAVCTSPISPVTAALVDGVAQEVDRSAIERGCGADATLANHGLPDIVEAVDSSGVSDHRSDWESWAPTIRAIAVDISTGPGLWIGIPAVRGLNRLADLTAFPVLVRDTDTATPPEAWSRLFSQQLPLSVRGMIVGASAIFPQTGSVENATMSIVAAVRRTA